jgi:hypothetical protein
MVNQKPSRILMIEAHCFEVKYPKVASPPNNFPGHLGPVTPPPPQYSAQSISQPASADLIPAFQSVNLSTSPIPTADQSVNLSTPPIPTADQCLVHLKLLESFFALRGRVSTTDGLFGIWDEMANKWQNPTQMPNLDLIREKRWAIYVARAVDRFQVWWEFCIGATKNGRPARKLKQVDLDGQAGKSYEDSFMHIFHFPHSADSLPPLGKSDIPVR